MSPHDEFQGLRNFTMFGTKVRPALPVENIKPSPTTWVQTATVSWLNRNDTIDEPNLRITHSKFEAEDSSARQASKNKAGQFENLRNEHTKVHM